MNDVIAALVGGLFDESGTAAYARPVLFGTAGDAVCEALPEQAQTRFLYTMTASLL